MPALFQKFSRTKEPSALPADRLTLDSSSVKPVTPVPLNSHC